MKSEKKNKCGNETHPFWSVELMNDNGCIAIHAHPQRTKHWVH